MILISFTLALIAIVFGMQLLALYQKDGLRSIYKYVAWFVIAMGFLVLMCDGARCLLRCCNMHRNGGIRREMMLNRLDNRKEGPMGRGMMNRNRGCRYNNNNCCDGLNNCCDGMNNGCNTGNYPDGMMNCPDGSGDMSSGCPIMNGEMKSKPDSGKTKK